MKNLAFTIVAIASIIVSCMLPTHVTQAARLVGPKPAPTVLEKPEAMIQQVLADQAKAWNEADMEGYMSGYWRSEETVFVSNGTVVRGWQAVLDRYKKTYPSHVAMGELAFSKVEVRLLGKGAAVVLGTWNLTRISGSDSGTFTLVFRKFGKDWRIVHDHTSTAG
ncbi:MAG: nuclear transport factor 2 family protein [Acidobacteria bacterium]|nr:nuclear transport factor 2 family protein [Acidobacteriota bacterium]